MKDYLYSLLVVAVLSLLTELLLPPGRERLRRAISFGLALAALLLVAAPLRGFEMPSLSWEDLPPSLDESITDGFAETEAAIAEAVGRGIAADLASHFAFSAEDVRVEVTLLYEGEEMKIGSLCITLGGSAQYADFLNIQAYAQKTYEVVEEVTVDGGNRTFG